MSLEEIKKLDYEEILSLGKEFCGVLGEVVKSDYLFFKMGLALLGVNFYFPPRDYFPAGGAILIPIDIFEEYEKTRKFFKIWGGKFGLVL